MQVNQFIHYLDHPKELLNVSEKEISTIIKEFPYCQTSQLMSAIHLNSNNSILFEEQLKRAASICPDRTKLFQHLHEKVASVSSEKKNEAQILLDAEEDKNSSTEKDKLKEDEVASLETTVENKKEEASTKLATKERLKEKFVPVDGEDELLALEKEYLTTAISSSILLEADDVVESSAQQEEEVEKEVELFDEQVEHSFSSWLNHYSAEDVALKEVKKDKKSSSHDIINRFIQEDPRIKPKKTAFYSPTNMARISVTDSGMVSETLALIHVDQGNFDGAIQVYEKLMLKNPKKSSYFAAQIKILKQKQK